MGSDTEKSVNAQQESDLNQEPVPLPVSGSYPVAETDIAARVQALESILLEKGLLSVDAIDKVVESYEKDIGPMLGAKVVARAWRDPEFRRRLLQNATEACRELGIGGAQGEHLMAIENTPKVHNVVVCTLCSCYPWTVLGLPPNWYKYPQYRSRIVIEPRKTLREDFGLEIAEDVEIRVWDSSAEIRYFVIPERPLDSEGMSEEELAQIVTREAMIGVARISSQS
jgi:nitrile hydratase subunit alpha